MATSKADAGHDSCRAWPRAWSQGQRRAVERWRFDPDMRYSLAAAARRYGVIVNLPSVAALKDNGIDPGLAAAIAADRLSKLAAASNGTVALAGDLQWSDAAHGWIASWTLEVGGRHFKGTARGVNFDEAFRVAVRGAGRALSGNGKP